MMNLLKRALAPVSDAAWDEIDEEARRVLASSLTARRIMDVTGPHGPAYAAVGLGRITTSTEGASDPVAYGIRRVLPLIELRASFELDRWELDNAERGAADIELDPLTEAARELAQFEERLVYHGLQEAGIEGLRDAAEQDPIPLGTEGGDYPKSIARALVSLREASIGGPYALVLGSEPFTALSAACQGCLPRQQIAQLLEGPVLLSPVIEGGFLLSTRGGDFEITLGQDASIGWQSHGEERMKLFLMESLTFRVLEPRAVVPLEG
ncbi:MAG: bacteriocin [Candidatus Eisenbacteria bacterium]|nr:bacteriocin [Candidatus Eisenbacteria bacterium]